MNPEFEYIETPPPIGETVVKIDIIFVFVSILKNWLGNPFPYIIPFSVIQGFIITEPYIQGIVEIESLLFGSITKILFAVCGKK